MMPFLFGSSPGMKELQRRVDSVAASSLPVLIEGESGSGKEALAHHIHYLGCPQGELVCFHCGRAGAEVLAGKLFRDHDMGGGKPRSTGPATLFLKNIDTLARPLQQRLLAAIQGGLDIEPTGNGHPSAVRLVSSATESLEDRVARGEFLPDLYFRLAVCRLSLPPLRHRTQDVPELFLCMVEQALPNGSVTVPPPNRLLQALASYPWPGNSRELQNFARNYAIAADPDGIIAELRRRSKALNLTPEHPEDSVSLREQVRRASKQLETEIILRTLERHRWNRRRTAQALRISYRALLYKMKDCNLRTEVEAAAE